VCALGPSWALTGDQDPSRGSLTCRCEAKLCLIATLSIELPSPAPPPGPIVTTQPTHTAYLRPAVGPNPSHPTNDDPHEEQTVSE